MERQVGGPPCASGDLGLQTEEGAPKMMASTCALLALLCFTLQACLGAQSNDGALASKSSPSAVPVEIVRPAGAGPFPAVVWMHSCAGVVRAARHMRDWTGRLVRLGYVVAIPDSFSPRGYHNGVCGYGALVPARLRADDAYAALRRVEALPNCRAAQGGLIGHLHGGWAALAATGQDNGAPGRAV